MKNQLIIRQAIIFLEEELLFHPFLSLKFSFNSQIFHHHGFVWNPNRRMWESKSTIKIPCPSDDSIELQVYYQHKTGRQVVLGEGRIANSSFDSYVGKEIKILLVYDGICTGTIYCQLYATEDEENQKAKKFLCVHRIDFKIFKEHEMVISLSMLKNGEELFQKNIQLEQNQKSAFPNIKTPIRLSDQITIRVGHPSISLADTSFLVDSLARGNNNALEVTIRNSVNGRAGKLKMDYFMQNFFLQNQKQIFVRHAIIAKQLIGLTILHPLKKPRIRRSGIIRDFEQSNKRLKLLDLTSHKCPIAGIGCSGQNYDYKQNRNSIVIPPEKPNIRFKKIRYSSQVQ